MTVETRVQRLDGFTLVEVMVAAAVMALAIVGMIQAVVSGSEMLDVARKQTIAAQIIHGQIDQIRLTNWTEMNSLVSKYGLSKQVSVEAGDQAGFVFGTSLPAISKDFTCTRSIAVVRTDLKKVTFTVTWRGNTGRTYTRSGATYVGRNGLYVTYQRS